MKHADLRNASKRLHLAGCLAPLTNGAPVCSDECDDLWWRVVPTTDGELWIPKTPREINYTRSSQRGFRSSALSNSTNGKGPGR